MGRAGACRSPSAGEGRGGVDCGAGAEGRWRERLAIGERQAAGRAPSSGRSPTSTAQRRALAGPSAGRTNVRGPDGRRRRRVRAWRAVGRQPGSRREWASSASARPGTSRLRRRRRRPLPQWRRRCRRRPPPQWRRRRPVQSDPFPASSPPRPDAGPGADSRGSAESSRPATSPSVSRPGPLPPPSRLLSSESAESTDLRGVGGEGLVGKASLSADSWASTPGLLAALVTRDRGRARGQGSRRWRRRRRRSRRGASARVLAQRGGGGEASGAGRPRRRRCRRRAARRCLWAYSNPSLTPLPTARPLPGGVYCSDGMGRRKRRRRRRRRKRNAGPRGPASASLAGLGPIVGPGPGSARPRSLTCLTRR